MKRSAVAVVLLNAVMGLACSDSSGDGAAAGEGGAGTQSAGATAAGAAQGGASAGVGTVNGNGSGGTGAAGTNANGSGAGGTGAAGMNGNASGAGGAGAGNGGTGEAGTNGNGSGTGGADAGNGGAGAAGTDAGGSGGSDAGAGAAGKGGTDGGGSMCTPTCLRSYECAESCDAEPFNNGCCTCPDGTIDIITCNTDGGDGYCGIGCTGAAPDPAMEAACAAITTQDECTAYVGTSFPSTCAWLVPPIEPCLAP